MHPVLAGGQATTPNALGKPDELISEHESCRALGNCREVRCSVTTWVSVNCVRYG